MPEVKTADMPSLAGSIFGLESIREVSDLYEGSEGIVQDPDGVFRCSVCGKKYKTRAGAKKHWEARDCWNVQDITRGTILEVRAYDLYLRVVKAFSPDDRRGASMPLASFRKNRGCYTNAAKTILFCDLNHVHDINEYLSWIFCTRDNIKTIWDLFGAAREQWILAEYRQDRHVCPTLFSSSREYVNQHRDRWEEAPEDLMREIMSARISL